MNPGQILTQIATILDARQPVSPGLYHLRIIEKQIVLDKDPPNANPVGEIAILTSFDVNSGPTNAMWRRIHDRLATFHKRGLI